MAKINSKSVWFGFLVVQTKQSLLDNLQSLEAQRDADLFETHRKAVIIGREIGELRVLRYIEPFASNERNKQFRDYFKFDELNKKYPINPLLEKPHGKE